MLPDMAFLPDMAAPGSTQSLLVQSALLAEEAQHKADTEAATKAAEESAALVADLKVRGVWLALSTDQCTAPCSKTLSLDGPPSSCSGKRALLCWLPAIITPSILNHFWGSVGAYSLPQSSTQTAACWQWPLHPGATGTPFSLTAGPGCRAE